MKTKLLTAIAIISIGLQLNAQTISTARSAAIGSTVTIKGIVLNGSELGNIRYVQDATAGISLYGTNMSTVNRGDSINATGTLTNYNNLLEVTPISSFTIPAAGKTLPAPALITPSQMTEAYESEMVRFDNCIFTAGGSTFTGNTNYTFTSSSQTGTVRIASASPLVGTIIPTGSVNLIGITSQYCSSPTSGCTTGYQLLLRDANDIINNASIFLTAQPYPTNIAVTGIDINWTTNIAGTSSYIKYGKTAALELGTVTASTASLTHTASITGASAATIYYARVYSINGTDTASSLTKVFCTRSNSTGKITAYFTKTVDNSVSTGTPAVQLNNLTDDTLIAYINRAQTTLDIAIYNWDNSNSNNITTAVNAAYTRGVKVRIVYDGSTSQTGMSALNAGIKKIASPQTSAYTIMHNKFVIVDANASNPNLPVVWTGSTNWTSAQLSTDANNVIIFQDQSIARGYKLEFDEMWGDTSVTSSPNTAASRFGQYKTDNTPHEYLIGGKRVESYFSPSDQTTSHILTTIATANTDLYLGQLLVTRSDLANKIASQITANSLTAKAILNDTASASTPYYIMKNVMGTNIQINKYSWMFHHKYLIVDQSNTASDPLVLTGSHNWSNSGESKNDENTVVVHDASIANQYYQEFSQRWNDQVPTGIADLNSGDVTISIYPNPNNGSFTVNCSTEKTEKVSMKLFDLMGRVVYSNDSKINSGLSTININIENLSKGIYTFAVVTETGKTTQKLVIQ